MRCLCHGPTVKVNIASGVASKTTNNPPYFASFGPDEARIASIKEEPRVVYTGTVWNPARRRPKLASNTQRRNESPLVQFSAQGPKVQKRNRYANQITDLFDPD